MRPMCTLEELRFLGVSRTAREQEWRRIIRGVYGKGTAPPTKFEAALAVVLATGGAASGRVAAALLGLDGVTVRGPDVSVRRGASNRWPGVRRRNIADDDILKVDGYRCTSGLLTLLDLAPEVDDLVWEQALESALRKRLVTVGDIEAALDGAPGAARMRRVLALRPDGAPATESILETFTVQLGRRIQGLLPPTRQFEVFDAYGQLVARVDLSWPELGVFIELDGQQHAGQPVYDASRETAVVAATGWLCGRFTWHEIVHVPSPTARRLAAIIDQARNRPFHRAS